MFEGDVRRLIRDVVGENEVTDGHNTALIDIVNVDQYDNEL